MIFLRAVPEYGLYQLRFSRSPLAGQPADPVVLRITPGQQRILGEAADLLRTRQPRAGVTIQGLVVRLHRSSAFGPGEAVIEGIAHRNGLQVSVTGNREERGTHLHLRRLTAFSVIPGLDYEEEGDLPRMPGVQEEPS